MKVLKQYNYIKKSIVLCIYGGGKSKTSVCIGIICRTLVYNLVVTLIWHAKYIWYASERRLGIMSVHYFNIFSKFLGYNWCLMIRIVGNPICMLTCFDELVVLFKYIGLINIGFRLRPCNLYIVCTSRRQSFANNFVNISCIQHHNDLGINAQLGMEY